MYYSQNKKYRKVLTRKYILCRHNHIHVFGIYFQFFTLLHMSMCIQKNTYTYTHTYIFYFFLQYKNFPVLTRTHNVLCLVAQLCLTLWDCSLPGSSVHGDSPGKNTGVGCYDLSRGSFQLTDWTQVSCIAGRFFTIWATRKPRTHNSYIHFHSMATLYKCSVFLIFLSRCFKSSDINLWLWYWKVNL